MELIDGIVVIEGLEPVRRRPTMYIGDVGFNGLHWLVRQLLECPRLPTEILVVVEPTLLQIKADAVPVRVDPRRPDRPPFLIEICSMLPVQIDEPPTLAPLDLLDHSTSPVVFCPSTHAPTALALANALSTRLTVASRTARRETTASFSAGRFVSGPDVSDTTDSDGVSIAFSPDPTIFGDTVFRFETICEIARDVTFVRQVTTTVLDLSTNTTFRCNPSPPPNPALRQTKSAQ